ncbi:hypothetical protein E2C01_066025 [Portunus trituberculatus]|uniref:Uncharacterized protein n=1 Tax=Portunus trituberculatus TaxID=210409 RepID=A0A5B7HPW7_PORTR|nr:hypothetical protein [Portunus trituberculatus]
MWMNACLPACLLASSPLPIDLRSPRLLPPSFPVSDLALSKKSDANPSRHDCNLPLERPTLSARSGEGKSNGLRL